MKSTIYQSPTTDLSEEIKFIKDELDFLLKILRNGYSAAVNIEKIKQLDSYWNCFEENIKALNLLFNKAQHITINIEPENNILKDINIGIELNKINKNIRTVKKSFYEFMQGCNACALKTNHMNYESSCI